MPVYSYQALSAQATVVRGTITADNPRSARESLRSRGLLVESVAERKSFSVGDWWRIRKSRHANKRVAFVRELSTLLAAGIPLLEALDSQIKQYRGGFRTCLMLIRDQVASGGTLADAMRKQPEVFDNLSIQMVEVGEHSGTLDQVLEQLGEFSEKHLQLKDRVTNALFYPLTVFVLSVGVGMFLMTVVVPMLLDNLLESEQSIPWPTMLLKTISDAIREHGLWIGLGFVLAVVGLIVALKTQVGRRLWHRLLLRIPVLGSMARKQEIARAALIIATLLKSGIVLLKAMEIAGRSMKNVVLRDAMVASREAITSGQEIGPALEATERFPPTVVQIFAVGQQSGKLIEMLERLAENYERQVTSLSSRLATLLEPILIVGLALFVGFILFATVLPILEAGNVLQ